MKIVMTRKLESVSSTKKAQKNAVIFFGKKGATILSKLEEYKKEKILNTPHLESMCEFLAKADPEQVEKASKSTAGKKIAAALIAVATAKSFDATVSAIKAARMPKSGLFDLSSKSSKPPASGYKFTVPFASMSDADVASLLKEAGLKVLHFYTEYDSSPYAAPEMDVTVYVRSEKEALDYIMNEYDPGISTSEAKAFITKL